MTKNRIANWAMNNGALLGLIALCIALFIATPYFLTVANLLNVGIQAATVAILAFGMTFVIVTAGIDLSVGSVAALGAMVSAYMFSDVGLPGWLTLLIGLCVGALAGAICGMATAWGKIPSFIATLAMMSIARGITLVISQGSPLETARTVNAFGGDVFGFPVPIIMMVTAGVICWFSCRCWPNSYTRHHAKNSPPTAQIGLQRWAVLIRYRGGCSCNCSYLTWVWTTNPPSSWGVTWQYQSARSDAPNLLSEST